ncbi:MAG: hypothetical protein Q7S68_04600 [Deltaproteobacteria bacterium]|nr:hypothetical protein [Deltaproteobacteria bacterium]
MIKIIVAGILAFSSLLYNLPAQAAVIDVSTLADEYNTSGVGAGCALREAVEAANIDLAFGGCSAGGGDDTINLPSGTYFLTQLGGGLVGLSEVTTYLGDIDINSNITIVGSTAEAGTIVDGGGVTNLFDIFAGKIARLVDLTVTNGGLHGTSGLQMGGGIINRGNLTLERVRVENCESSPPASGPGTATYGGGGIYSLRVGSLILLESSVIGNTTTGNGGGIAIEGSHQISNSTISENSAVGLGGGIYIGGNTWGATTLTDNTVANNNAGAGMESGEEIFRVANSNTALPSTESPAIPVATKESSTESTGTTAPAMGSPASGGCGQIASGKVFGDGRISLFLLASVIFLLSMRRKLSTQKR